MATETIEATDHKLLVAGEWIETGEWSEVKSPYDGTLIGRVPTGDAALVDEARSMPRPPPTRPDTSPSTSAPPSSTAPPNWSPSARMTSPRRSPPRRASR